MADRHTRSGLERVDVFPDSVCSEPFERKPQQGADDVMHLLRHAVLTGMRSANDVCWWTEEPLFLRAVHTEPAVTHRRPGRLLL